VFDRTQVVYFLVVSFLGETRQNAISNSVNGPAEKSREKIAAFCTIYKSET
jgi:hypothetical protein